MDRRVLATFALCVAVLPCAVRAQDCSSIPGSLVNISDPLHPAFTGIDFTYLATTPNNFETGGIAVGDYNNDGLEDVLLPGGKTQRNFLYEAQPGGGYVNVGLTKGLVDGTQHGGAALFLDYENDGDLDIFVAGHAGGPGTQAFRLYRNSGAAGSFNYHDVTGIAKFEFDPSTVEGSQNGMLGGVTAGDYDLDGYPDLFMGWWFTPVGMAGPQHDMWRLYRSAPNTDAGTNDPANPAHSPRIYVDKTRQAGLDIDIDLIPDLDGGPTGGDCWQPTFVDINNDGWPDLHVNIDFGGDFLFLNNRDTTFTDVATAVGINGNPPEVRNEMGVSFADVDNDGDLDVHKTNVAAGQDNSQSFPKMFEDRFYRNDSVGGVLSFVDMGPVTGVMNSEVGWGTISFDFDNDGDLDQAFVTGMRVVDDPHYNLLHINQYPAKASDGISPLYCEATHLVPEYAKLPVGDDLSRALVPLDIDADGDLDLIVGKAQDTFIGGLPMLPNEVYENTLVSNNDWIRVDLIERGGSLNTINSRLWLRSTGRTQHKQVLAGTSFHGFESPRQHFGLGRSGQQNLKWLVIRWPGMGNYQYVDKADLAVKRVNVIVRDEHNDLGDLNVDGQVNDIDVALLELLIDDPATFDALYPDSPAYVLGDCNADNTINHRDLEDLLKLLTLSGF